MKLTNAQVELRLNRPAVRTEPCPPPYRDAAARVKLSKTKYYVAGLLPGTLQEQDTNNNTTIAPPPALGDDDHHDDTAAADLDSVYSPCNIASTVQFHAMLNYQP